MLPPIDVELWGAYIDGVVGMRPLERWRQAIDAGGDLLDQLHARPPARSELWERMLRLAKAR